MSETSIRSGTIRRLKARDVAQMKCQGSRTRPDCSHQATLCRTEFERLSDYAEKTTFHYVCDECNKAFKENR